VYFPLKLISRTLTANDVSHIRRLFKKGDEFGDISGLIRTFFEQKETLKESEQYVTAILNSLQSGILVIDAASHVIAYANPAAARMIGVPVEKIVGANCQQYVCPAEIGKCPITDLGKTVDNAERVLLSATGWRIPIIKTVNFITLKGRRYLIESFVDITDRKKAEEEIKNAYQMTRSILEKSPFGVYLVNDAGFIDYVNPAMLKISGDSYVQFKNVNVFDLPAYRQSGIAQKIDTALKGESFHAGNVEISSVSKKASVLNIFGMPFYERGETKALIFAEDVTELKKLEEIKNSLTHMIIHDLNNPLTALLGSLQLLQLDLGPSLTEDQKASLEIMVLASQDLRRITRDLLDINKMESGTIKLNPQPISLSGLAREVVEQMKVAANNSGKSLIMEEPPELPAVNADQEIIHRVIANLINNSLKFTPQKGSVTVKLFLAEQGKNVRVQIKDTGEGIQPDYLDKIFDKFFQVQTEKAQFGHGLGLTFCKMMVEAHGGRIWAESDGPGTGSTFTFSLPV
jgi:PAS domain S-box-containing protein